MKKILIAVDLQNDFIDGSLGTKKAENIVKKAADKIREFQGDIIVTYDTHCENYLSTAEGKKLPIKHCIKGTPGWMLNEEIIKALKNKNYVSIEKTSFGSVDLPAEILKIGSGENFSVEIIGLCTDICVVSNALILKAFFPEKEITVDSSCCAGTTSEAHNAALAVMKSCQINVI